jgi:hypothetical protein
MNRPVLVPLETSEAIYKELRDIKDAVDGLAPVGMIFGDLETDLYAKVLVLMKLASSISSEMHENELRHAEQAKNALCAIASLESSLAAAVMTRKAEDLVLAAEQAEADALT